LIIGENSKVANRCIRDLEKNKDYLIIAIYEDKELKIPDGDTKLKPKNRVIVLAKKDAVDYVRKLFL